MGTSWQPGLPFGPAPATQRRHGYTLLELMLVLGILLVLAGIAWPGVQSMYERHRLQSAAEDVRAHLAGTRLRAIEDGLIYQFQYESGGQSYSISPFESATAVTPAATATLPEHVRFDVPDAPSDSPALLFNDAISAVTGQNSSSIPILFTPDGSALDSTLVLTDDEGRTIPLSVRGLTGTVTVGPVQQRAGR